MKRNYLFIVAVCFICTIFCTLLNTHVFDERTMCGALETHISTPQKNFQPMNANYGILAPMSMRIRDKKERYRALSERAIAIVQAEKDKEN